jgi:hypothetical protein
MTEPCRTACPADDCAGRSFPPDCRTNPATRELQLRAHEQQKRQEREFAFERRQPTEEFA